MSPCSSRAVTHRPPATAGGEGAPGVPPVCASSGASQSQRAAHVAVPLARRDPPLARHGQRRDVRWACHVCVPHPARRDRSELSTSSCRSRDATPRLPAASAGGGMCAGRATCVCRFRRVVFAASRARLRAARATRPPARLLRPAAGCAPGAPPVCAASGASRSSRARLRAARATRPPARLLRPAAGGAPGVPPVWAASGASRS
jgi:hypothetical protein